MIPLVEYYLEKIDSEFQNKKIQSLKFLDDRLLNNPKLVVFQKNLFDYNLIDKIDPTQFCKMLLR